MSNHGAISTMVYKDTNAALNFFTSVLGFREHAVFRDDKNKVQHAELTLGKAMIMIGSYHPESEFGKMIGTPAETNGLNTQTAYIIIEDVDDHYKNAKSNGAKIVMDIKDEDYGGRGYSCKDPEGCIWNFGNYNPYSEK
ncbi:VOC family protein [Aequorivita sp. KMM 9714]|uniref:VOC family protein n=1 Tax=Aequorivita sp. KMM 9714 TaxID=2707173 RepID=UPI0013ECC2CC|nr:VOC family protein [Aequorivita sp. KMM 9714]NGX83085.1 glyoxalase [Aequorivita sp. KMM 9714]